MTKIFMILFSFAFVATSFANSPAKKKDKPKKVKLEKGIYAKMTTNKGIILIQLEYEKAPMTVANFVGLAEGDFTVEDSIKYTESYYDGLVFHRVMNDFMIQGGDPDGNGSGGPEHRFYDEIDSSLIHSGPGILSMANSGPNTNGSQFFITHKDTPWLNGKHTVFGHVVAGMDVVNAIVQGDTIIELKIVRKGRTAKKWNATEEFAAVYDSLKGIEIAQKEEYDRISAMSQDEYKTYMYNEILKDFPNAKQSASGLVYIIENEGEGAKGSSGAEMTVHYKGTFRKSGDKFDSSYDRGQAMTFKYLEQRMIPGFEEGLAMFGKGGKGKLIIPYYAAYGAQGRPGAIPPYSDLVFDIEMVDLKMAKPHVHTEGDGHQH